MLNNMTIKDKKKQIYKLFSSLFYKHSIVFVSFMKTSNYTTYVFENPSQFGLFYCTISLYMQKIL